MTTIKQFQDLSDSQLALAIDFAKEIHGNIISFNDDGSAYLFNALIKHPTNCVMAFTMDYLFEDGALVNVSFHNPIKFDGMSSSTLSKEYWKGSIIRLKKFIDNNLNYRDRLFTPRY